ncbi:MAG: hypothetical protein ABI866_13740, partial [Dokdonella sp.]
KQIEPSFSFTSLYNSNDFNETRNARYLRLFTELGGLTRPLYQDALLRQTGLNVYDFARISADYRRYYHLTPQTYFVWRLNGGAVHALTRTLVLGKTMLSRMAFTGAVGLARYDLRCADDTMHRRGALRADAQCRIRKTLQHFHAIAAMLAMFVIRDVLVYRHAGRMRPRGGGINRSGDC